MIAPRPASKGDHLKLEFRRGTAGSEKIDHAKATVRPIIAQGRAEQSIAEQSRLMMQAAAIAAPVVFVVDDDFDVRSRS